MSELAFDKEGEPIEQHEECELWRVRRFRNPGMRGTCETVREDDGAPLYVAADCSFLEFKRLVGGEPGFYRLDQCDVRRQPIADASPAYVSIVEGQRNGATANGEDPRDNVIRELARANADMCRTIAGQASDMMRAAAELMRAADGAGIPRRAPLPPLEREDDDTDEDDDQEHDDQPNVWALVEQMLPSVQVWLASMAAKRTATPAPAAAPAPSPAPASAPAPAAAPTAAPGSGSVAAGVNPTGTASSPSPAPDGTAVATTTPASPEPAQASTEPTGAAAEPVRNASVTPDQLAHLFEIRARLTPREAAFADAVVTRMSPDVQAQWLAELSVLSVDEAVEIVRSMIPKTAATSTPPPTTPAPAKDEA